MAYPGANTFEDPSDGLGPRPGGPAPVPARKVHPLHWLLDGHWLGRWRTPLLLKLWRYGAGSVFAFVTSAVVLSVCFSWIGLGAFTSSTIAFFAGAIPNWILNRRWAWQKKDRKGVGRETTLYAFVSAVSWLASSGVTKITAEAANHTNPTARDLLVTASYMFSIVVLTGLKYVAYDRLVFVDRSRHQVRSTTEQNRIP
ncbi:MAG: GtrA family protein [Acidimicrobiales bacterium]